MTASSTSQPVLSASAFIGSIGVNAHTGYSWGAYNNASLVVDNLRYLGVTTVRDAFATDPSAAPVMNALAAAGVKFDFVVSSDLPASGSAGLQQYLASVAAFQAGHPGSVTALEGLNEANIQSFSYHGSSSMAAAAQFQTDFYNSIKGNAQLSGVSVYNMTLGLNDANAYGQLGNLSKSSDYSNAHAYVATSTPESYGLDVSLDLAKAAASGKPSVITETGYTTQASAAGLGTDQTVQAKSILNTLVDAFRDGVSKTYLYELLDRDSSASNKDPEAHFGLFNADGSPKLAATAIHNLTTILADDGQGGHQPTASLNYTLGNLPATGNSMVLAKSNGAYELVVWAEPKMWNDATDTEIANPTNTVSVHLGSVHHTVTIYDPMNGTTPIASYTNVQDFQIPVSDHPLVVEIDAPATTVTAPTGPVHVTGTAADIVSQLSALNAEGTVKVITLTDSHTLSVASEATMKYMISHYGSVLSAIQGGYSFAVTISTSAWSLTTNYDAAGHQTSTEQIAYSNGVTTFDLVTYADGSTAASNYSNGVKTVTTVTNADHSKDVFTYGITGKTYVTEIQHTDPNGKVTAITHVNANGSSVIDQYNSAGKLTAETVIGTDGSSTTSVFASGTKTNMFVNNADSTHDNYIYGVQGQSYTAQVQHVDASGKVTSVTRTHANGSLDYTETTAGDGTVTTTQYDANGLKSSQSVVHGDGSKDIYSLNIKNHAYTTEHSTFDASGNLLTFERLHGDGTLAFKVTNSHGNSTTDQYDAVGVITSEATTHSDGSSATTIFTNGVKTNMYVVNADHTQDNYNYNVAGQSYTAVHQHTDPSGKVISAIRTHADGTLDFTLDTKSDGSVTATYYDAHGVKASQSTVALNGNQDVYSFSASGAIQHNTYDPSGTLKVADRTNADATHVVTANVSGAVISGGNGNDSFTAAGATTIKFDHGNDQVSNFHAGSAANHDIIQIAQSLVNDYSHLQFQQTGADTLVHITATDSVLLKNVKATSLDHGNFLFA